MATTQTIEMLKKLMTNTGMIKTIEQSYGRELTDLDWAVIEIMFAQHTQKADMREIIDLVEQDTVFIAIAMENAETPVVKTILETAVDSATRTLEFIRKMADGEHQRSRRNRDCAFTRNSGPELRKL